MGFGSKRLELIRSLALSLERVVAREAASGAIRGAADGLREELPDVAVDGADLVELANDALTVLRGLLRRAAELEEEGLDPAIRSATCAATRGALDELERQWREGGLPLHDFAMRLNRLFDRAAEYANERASLLRDPEARTRGIALNAMDGVLDRLHAEMPTIQKDLRELAPVAREIATSVGNGLLDGLAARLDENADAFGDLLERAGRSFARGVAGGFREQVEALNGAALRGAMAATVEEAAGAAVKGARRALGDAANPATLGALLEQLTESVVSGTRRGLGSVVRPELVAKVAEEAAAAAVEGTRRAIDGHLSPEILARYAEQAAGAVVTGSTRALAASMSPGAPGAEALHRAGRETARGALSGVSPLVRHGLAGVVGAAVATTFALLATRRRR